MAGTDAEHGLEFTNPVGSFEDEPRESGREEDDLQTKPDARNFEDDSPKSSREEDELQTEPDVRTFEDNSPKSSREEDVFEIEPQVENISRRPKLSLTQDIEDMRRSGFYDDLSDSDDEDFAKRPNACRRVQLFCAGKTRLKKVKDLSAGVVSNCREQKYAPTGSKVNDCTACRIQTTLRVATHTGDLTMSTQLTAHII
eukprot:SAG31_NODE_11023_length_1073_cov_1.144764_2_plen_199_part_00